MKQDFYRRVRPLTARPRGGKQTWAAPSFLHPAAETRETPGDEPDDDGPLSDEDFDRLLDEFIAGEQASLESDADAPDGETLPDDSRAAAPADAGDEVPLDELTGLESVKRKLDTYARTARFSAQRRAAGLAPLPMPLHAMFVGAPGTGKTTVARQMGRLLAREGLLSSGHVVVRERATLLGQNYASESENTLEALRQAEGGILFIDEAYQLFQPHDPRDPGRFVIETLLTALADPARRDWMLILAGYPAEMRRMFEMNPGLRSRIPESNIYEFEDFSARQLLEIAERHLARHGFTLTPEAREALGFRLAADWAQRGPDFGNARHVTNLVETLVLPAMAVRLSDVAGPSREQLMRVEAADIPLPALRPRPARPRIGFAPGA